MVSRYLCYLTIDYIIILYLFSISVIHIHYSAQQLYMNTLSMMSPSQAANLLTRNGFSEGMQSLFSYNWRCWLLRNNDETQTPTPPPPSTATHSSQLSITSSSAHVMKTESAITADEMNLTNILEWSGKVGKEIRTFYDAKSLVEESHRKDLMHSIVSYCNVHGIKLNVGMCRMLTQEIVEAFPSELEVFYHRPMNGPLLSKFNHSQRTNKKKRNEKADQSVDVGAEPKSKKNRLNDDEIRDRIVKLNNSSTLTADEFLELWRSTAQTRCDFIKAAKDSKSIYVMWKQYKDAKAPNYVIIMI